MLASYTRYSAHAFLPAIPSPLSPRSANIDAPPAFFTQTSAYMSDAPSQSLDKENKCEVPDQKQDDLCNAFSFPFAQSHASSTESKPQTYAQRARTVKKAPLPKQDELRDRRRGNFLRRVREARDDDRWETRGEDMLRAEWMRERRAREEELAGSAPEVEGEDMIDAEEEMRREAEAEEWDRWEEGELDELIGLAPGEDERMDEHEFSDGEVWEEVYEDYLRSSQQKGEGRRRQPHDGMSMVLVPDSSSQGEFGEAMDMS